MKNRKLLGRIPTEHDEQRMLVNWLRLQGIRHFAVPNGAMLGGRKYGQLNKLKAEGLLIGAPDIVLIDRTPGLGIPVAVEMKRSRQATLSHQQLAVHADMTAAGWIVVVARGAEDAMRQLMDLGY